MTRVFYESVDSPRAPALPKPTFFRKAVRCAFASVKSLHSSFAITVILTSDERMRMLNTAYRGLRKTTDVLSFLIDPPTRTRQGEGEIYISISRARAQQVRYAVSLEEEFARLTIHGVLHILGYDHADSHERKRMRAFEHAALHCLDI